MKGTESEQDLWGKLVLVKLKGSLIGGCLKSEDKKLS
jgi:hypothetical protein